MENIIKTVSLNIDRRKAFSLFTNALIQWWPKEYTWSQDKLVEMKIEASENGLCTEIGPHGFRCDWGRVTKVSSGELIQFLWQVGAKREPVPDPQKSSVVTASFEESAENQTLLSISHNDFENHGKKWEEYRNAMDSDQGWDYILKCFSRFITESSKTEER